MVSSIDSDAFLWQSTFANTRGKVSHLEQICGSNLLLSYAPTWLLSWNLFLKIASVYKSSGGREQQCPVSEFRNICHIVHHFGARGWKTKSITDLYLYWELDMQC